MPNVVFTHDDEIADFTTFAANVSLSGGVHVHEGAYVGAGAAVRENLTIGSNSLVGMGSVVTHDVPADEVWVGNPARCFMTATPLPSRVPA
jgi:acetyltransferase-like isoleucine patch superfamily enzyme